MRVAKRAERIAPFYVMEVGKAAARLQAQNDGGPEMIYLNIGEPDFTAPPQVQGRASEAIANGLTQYTQALGIEPLREKISQWYAERFQVDVASERIILTAGASAALQLACLALIDSGDEMLMPDPSYPCNRQFVQAADGVATAIPVGADSRFQLTAHDVRQHWVEGKTRGVLLASPSNPTGTSLPRETLAAIHAVVQEKGGVSIVDEIYLGLSYDAAYGQTALSLDDNIISINSFSKYFNMTGWRLGWLVVPPALVGTIEKLAQNLFICPSAIAQHAALACFEADSLQEYERRRAIFRSRRDLFVPQLEALGFVVPVMPDGAFYIWAQCEQVCQRLGVADSWDLAFTLLEKARIAIAPGKDFGGAGMEHYVRFSIANSTENLQLAIDRMRALLA